MIFSTSVLLVCSYLSINLMTPVEGDTWIPLPANPWTEYPLADTETRSDFKPELEEILEQFAMQNSDDERSNWAPAVDKRMLRFIPMRPTVDVSIARFYYPISSSDFKNIGITGARAFNLKK